MTSHLPTYLVSEAKHSISKGKHTLPSHCPPWVEQEVKQIECTGVALHYILYGLNLQETGNS